MTSQTWFQNNAQNSNTPPKVVTVMVPFPMQGHLNEALHLSHLINSYGIPVHYVGYALYNRQAKLRLHGRNPKLLTKINFHDLQLPILNDSIASNRDDRIKFPGHLQPLFDATMNLRQPMFQLLQELSTKFTKIVVIHDTLMASVVQDVKLIPNAESFAFHSISAFSIFFYMWESMIEKPFQLHNNIHHIPSNEGCFTPEFINFVAKQHKVLNFESGRLYNTCRLLEGKYMDLLEKLPLNSNKKLFAIGPLNPVHIKTGNKENQHRCLKWLDKQEVDSVIYVSFGTSTTMTNDQIKELALGIEKSRQKFIWVLRNADKLDVFGEVEGKRPLQLPEGYEERVQDQGIIVKEWAPQLEILAHSSTGGFISHCGWNSCMESISMGVPIAAWPLHSDQPKNSVLVTKMLRIGTVDKSDLEKYHSKTEPGSLLCSSLHDCKASSTSYLMSPGLTWQAVIGGT